MCGKTYHEAYGVVGLTGLLRTDVCWVVSQVKRVWALLVPRNHLTQIPWPASIILKGVSAHHGDSRVASWGKWACLPSLSSQDRLDSYVSRTYESSGVTRSNSREIRYFVKQHWFRDSAVSIFFYQFSQITRRKDSNHFYFFIFCKQRKSCEWIKI